MLITRALLSAYLSKHYQVIICQCRGSNIVIHIQQITIPYPLLSPSNLNFQIILLIILSQYGSYKAPKHRKTNKGLANLHLHTHIHFWDTKIICMYFIIPSYHSSSLNPCKMYFTPLMSCMMYPSCILSQIYALPISHIVYSLYSVVQIVIRLCYCPIDQEIILFLYMSKYSGS